MHGRSASTVFPLSIGDSFAALVLRVPRFLAPEILCAIPMPARKAKEGL